MLTTILFCLLGLAPATTTASPAPLPVPDIIPEGWHGVRVEREADLDALRQHCCVQFVIREGDTLEKIARSELGSAGRLADITALNPEVEPRRLKIGQRIWLPPRDANAPHRFVYINTWPRTRNNARPFAVTDTLRGRYSAYALVIVDEAARSTFEQQKQWSEVLAMQEKGKLQVVEGESVRGLVRDGSAVERIRDRAVVRRDAKGRFSIEHKVERFDGKGRPIATDKADDKRDQMWLLLVALGGASLIWLRVRAQPRRALAFA
ncbi:MAG: LysM peptidoglycan-binding domain-containing protein [Planctomycetes bacterium]|nr:LysM peptidoglycan-binding domain-containing protein [Planctomycetota bacterium]